MRVLSICIPTFNRRAMLAELLNSIAGQGSPEEVEICISDNASTDDTQAWVGEFRLKWPSLVYHRAPENVGPDLNYLKCVEMASSTYCWLMGSDDCVAPGALRRVLDLIRKEPRGIYLGSRINCTVDMRPIAVEHMIDGPEDRHFDFSSDADFDDYHRRAQSIGALFSYLSSIIVRRNAWRPESLDARYISSGYCHAFILLMAARQHGIRFVRQPIVLNRGGNDSFLHSGVAKRTLLDLHGYLMLADDIYPESPGRRNQFLKVLRRTHPAVKVSILLRGLLDDGQWASAEDTLSACGYPPLVLALVSPLKALCRRVVDFRHGRGAL